VANFVCDGCTPKYRTTQQTQQAEGNINDNSIQNPKTNIIYGVEATNDILTSRIGQAFF